VGEVRTQPEAQTIVRVIQHLGISMRQLAREMEVTMNSLWPKLGGDIVLRDKDIIAAAKAIKVPVKVLRLSGVDAIQYLLDREKAKAP
jgi:lambda repressor-like predicted transcriptional regulator